MIFLAGQLHHYPVAIEVRPITMGNELLLNQNMAYFNSTILM